MYDLGITDIKTPEELHEYLQSDMGQRDIALLEGRQLTNKKN